MWHSVPSAPLRDYIRRNELVVHPTIARRLAPSNERILFHSADDICNAIGVHMSMIYGDIYWEADVLPD